MRSTLAVLLLIPAASALAQAPSAAAATATSGVAAGGTREPTTNHTVAAVKMAAPPTIDGTITDDEWKDAGEFTGMYDAVDNSPCPERAIFWLGYDDKYIYFAARAYDSQPNAIKMTEYRTNVSLKGDDFVQVDIDPYGALTDWSHFSINPRGATMISIAGGRAAKREWIGDFVAKSRMTPEGWETEARIPWALMKLPGGGTHDVRFDFDRCMARTNHTYDFTQNTMAGDLRGVGDWKGVQLPKIEEDRILQFLPYSYQGVDTHGAVANGGLDLKMPITEQMTLVGTANPDFRNIENQILSIDFSRFERIANESRPFFQEGQQYYGSALIASQRVKDFDTGVNVYGKVNNKIAMGLVDAANFGNENDLMTTWQYSPDQLSTLRFSHSSLASTDIKNQGYLLAYNRQLSKSTSVFLRGMSTHDATVGRGDERQGSVSFVHGEWQVYGQYRQISPDFLPRLGFQPEKDFKGPMVMVNYDHQIKTGTLSEIAAGAYGLNYQHFAGGDYRRNTGGDLYFTFRNNVQYHLNGDYNVFEGSHDHTNTFEIKAPWNDPYRNWLANYTWGNIEGSDYRSIAIGSAYRPTNRFQLTLTSQFVKFQGDQKQLILGGNYDLGNDRAISGRLVQGDHSTNAYVALQRSGGAGIEYFLILGDPNALSFRRSLILKVTYPLQMFLGKHGH